MGSRGLASCANAGGQYALRLEASSSLCENILGQTSFCGFQVTLFRSFTFLSIESIDDGKVFIDFKYAFYMPANIGEALFFRGNGFGTH